MTSSSTGSLSKSTTTRAHRETGIPHVFVATLRNSGPRSAESHIKKSSQLHFLRRIVSNPPSVSRRAILSDGSRRAAGQQVSRRSGGGQRSSQMPHQLDGAVSGFCLSF